MHVHAPVHVPISQPMFPYSTQQTTPQLNPVRSPPPPGTVFASFTGTPFSFFRFLGAFAFSFTYKQLRSRSPVRSHPPGRTVFAFIITVRFCCLVRVLSPRKTGCRSGALGSDGK